MITKSKILIPVLCLFGTASSLASDWFSSTDIAQAASPELARAHNFALKSNYRAMAEELKNALMKNPNDPDVLDNVLGLLKQVRAEVPHGNIPINWTLPQDILQLKVVAANWRSPYSHEVKYDLRVQATAKLGKHVEQIQLIRYPNEVVYDLSAGIGRFDRETDDEGYETVASYHDGGSHQPPHDGLYLLNIKAQGGPAVQGWVILSDMTAKTLPEITAPASAQVYQTATPAFSWKDFKSSLYQPEERRRRTLTVYLAEDNGTHQLWRDVEEDPTKTEVTCKTLERGQKYRFMINFNEMRYFGDVILNRQMGASQLFSIAP